jgi:predicted amidohydrolase
MVSVVLGSLGFGQEAQSLKVAAVQLRNNSFDVQHNTKRIIDRLEALAAEGVQVAVFPECAIPGFHNEPVMTQTAEEIAAAEDRIQYACRRLKIAAVVGSIYKVNDKTFNSAVVFNSSGELIERYGKVMAGEKWAARGNHIALFELEGVLSTLIICHDERYPELVRLPAMAGARIVYYISAEAGMQKEFKLPGYRAQIVARAVENGIYAVCANPPANIEDNSGSHGQSRIVKHDGNILQEASFYGEEILIETLTFEAEPFSDWPRKPLTEFLGDWWRQGLEIMKKNLGKKLE